MSDNLVEVTSKSWFERLFAGIGGIFTGFILVLVACVALFWNEGRAVKTMLALEEGAGQVISIDSGSVDAFNEGKLVHVSGSVRLQDLPIDPLFDSLQLTPDTISIIREVEMFQWNQTSKTETQKKVGGGETEVTTYSYEKEWASGRNDSAGFKQALGHDNPLPLVDAEQFVAPTAQIGAFEFDGGDLDLLGTKLKLSPTKQMAVDLSSSLGGQLKTVALGDYVIVGENPAVPVIGDLRISFSAKQISNASIVGEQRGTSVTPFTTRNGRTIFLRDGKISDAAAMFADAQGSNTTITWLFRVGGLLAMLIGFRTLFAIVGIMGDLIPFIGNAFRFATGLAAFALTSLLGPIVIAIAWIAYRPLWGFAILALGLASAAMFIALGKKRAAAAQMKTVEA